MKLFSSFWVVEIESLILGVSVSTGVRLHIVYKQLLWKRNMISEKLQSKTLFRKLLSQSGDKNFRESDTYSETIKIILKRNQENVILNN